MAATSESGPGPGLLDSPLELRQHIYKFLFRNAILKTEHPFPICRPPGGWSCARDYSTMCLVNRECYQDVKAYYTKHIAPHATFYFQSADKLRLFVSRYANHPVLQHSTFSLQQTEYGTRAPYKHDHTAEMITWLIRIQPGFAWTKMGLPGIQRPSARFYRTVNYFETGLSRSGQSFGGEVPAYTVCERTDSGLCPAEHCYQHEQGLPNAGETSLGQQDDPGEMTFSPVQPVKVMELRYPPLVQTASPVHIKEEADWCATGKGELRLTAHQWTSRSTTIARTPCDFSTLVLEGNIRDVWVPEDVVEELTMHGPQTT